MRRILLIDDTPLFLAALSDAFAADYDVTTAKSGEDAVAILEQMTADASRFDLIITDLNMPGMNGFDLSQYIKARNVHNRFIPVILLTSAEVTKEVARRYGCAACLPKSDLKRVVSMTHILLRTE